MVLEAHDVAAAFWASKCGTLSSWPRRAACSKRTGQAVGVMIGSQRVHGLPPDCHLRRVDVSRWRLTLISWHLPSRLSIDSTHFGASSIPLSAKTLLIECIAVPQKQRGVACRAHVGKKRDFSCLFMAPAPAFSRTCMKPRDPSHGPRADHENGPLSQTNDAFRLEKGVDAMLIIPSKVLMNQFSPAEINGIDRRLQLNQLYSGHSTSHSISR